MRSRFFVFTFIMSVVLRGGVASGAEEGAVHGGGIGAKPKLLTVAESTEAEGSANPLALAPLKLASLHEEDEGKSEPSSTPAPFAPKALVREEGTVQQPADKSLAASVAPKHLKTYEEIESALADLEGRVKSAVTNKKLPEYYASIQILDDYSVNHSGLPYTVKIAFYRLAEECEADLATEIKERGDYLYSRLAAIYG